MVDVIHGVALLELTMGELQLAEEMLTKVRRNNKNKTNNNNHKD